MSDLIKKLTFVSQQYRLSELGKKSYEKFLNWVKENSFDYSNQGSSKKRYLILDRRSLCMIEDNPDWSEISRVTEKGREVLRRVVIHISMMPKEGKLPDALKDKLRELHYTQIKEGSLEDEMKIPFS